MAHGHDSDCTTADAVLARIDADIAATLDKYAPVVTTGIGRNRQCPPALRFTPAHSALRAAFYAARSEHHDRRTPATLAAYREAIAAFTVSVLGPRCGDCGRAKHDAVEAQVAS